jgi:hypothetical protein
MAELDQITVATHRMIRKTPKLLDMVFQNDPLLALLKKSVKEIYGGGRFIGENFIYNGLIGGPYLQGKEFDITEPQVEQQLQFNVKFFEVNVTLSKEDIQVINKGENAAFRLIESRMNNAYMSIGAHMAIGLYLNGINANYTANWNGLPEMLNDNSTASWDGNTYSTYGTITRGGAVGAVLNAPPTNVNGTIEYPTLEETYADACYGTIEPNIGLTTAKGYSYIKEKFQTQQRFNDTQEPSIGFNGLKFNSATILKSRYCPGTYISGTNDPIAVTYIKQMSLGALVAYPTVTAETLWWLNARKPYMTLYLSNDAEYGLGFTGFKPGQGNTKVAGQVLCAAAFTGAPRYHRQLYGITG